MKCKSCNKEITKINCHVFDFEGKDSNISLEIKGDGKDGTCFHITSPLSITALEFQDCFEEFIDLINCPSCGKYPFNQNKGISLDHQINIIFDIFETKVIE